MKTSKRILSSILAILMVFSVCSTGFTATAVESNSAILKDIVLEPIARPEVEFYCTEITRVAAAVNSTEPGSTIVKATPSGVPELSGAYAAQAYAGETPAATRVTFVTPTTGISITGFSCDNETVEMTDMVYSAPGTYYVDVIGGTAQMQDGKYKPLVFTIDYKWIDGNSYQEKCVSYVEGIVTGGSYVEAQSEIQALSGTGSYYRVYASASTRLLGKGVYYEQPASITTNVEDPYRSYGVYNVATGTATENVASGYNTSLFRDDKSEKPAGKHNQALEFFVPGTTLAHVYVDASEAKTLADINLRLDANVGALSDRNNSNPYTALADAWVSAGSNVDSAVTTNDATAQAAIGLAIPAKADYGVKQYNQNASMTTLTGGVGQYQNLFTAGLTGNVANLIDGSSYTITTKYYAYMWVQKGLLQHYNMTSAATVPTSITFHVVDKSALRELIDYVMNSDPDSPSTRANKKGVNPQAWYYRSGFSQFQTAYTDALAVLNNPRASQEEIDAAARSLQTMYGNLSLKTADYTRVDDLNEIADEILENEDAYAPQAISLIKEAQDGVTKSYNILYQGAVDTMADNLQTAIDSAIPLAANYAEVYAAIAEADKLTSSAYTAESWKALENAIAAVDYTKTALEQDVVDGYAKAITDAIANLDPLTANLSALKATLAEAKAIDRSLYINGALLKDQMDNAEDVIAACEAEAWPVERQDEVDAAEQALRDAIKALILRSVYKVDLKAAIDAEIPGNEDYYNQFILADYKALVAEGQEMYDDKTLTILDQAAIDALTAEITAKYEELLASYKVPGVDKTALVDALVKADAVNIKNYIDDEAKDEFLAAVAEGEEILERELVTNDENAKIVADSVARIEAAIENLNLKAADLSALNGLLDTLAAMADETVEVVTYIDGALGTEAKAKYDAEAIQAIVDSINSFLEADYTIEDTTLIANFVSETQIAIKELSVLTYGEYLAVAVAEYEAVEDPTIYSEDTWKPYEAAYDAAVALKGASQAEINTALTNLVNAKGELALAWTYVFEEEADTSTVINRDLGVIYGLDIGLSDIEDYVEYAEGVTIEADGYGTGAVLNTVANGEVIESFVIIIFGDLTGDGAIDIYDASTLAAIVNGDIEIEEGSAIALAADLNGDTAIDTYDLTIISALVNGDIELDQGSVL